MASSEGASRSSVGDESSPAPSPAGGPHADRYAGEGDEGSGGEAPDGSGTDEDLRSSVQGSSGSDNGSRSRSTSGSTGSQSARSEGAGRSTPPGIGSPLRGPLRPAGDNRLLQFGFTWPDTDQYRRLDFCGRGRVLIGSLRHHIRRSQSHPGGTAALPSERERAEFLRVHPAFAGEYAAIQNCVHTLMPGTFGATRGRLAEVVDRFIFEAACLVQFGYGATDVRPRPEFGGPAGGDGGGRQNMSGHDRDLAIGGSGAGAVVVGIGSAIALPVMASGLVAGAAGVGEVAVDAAEVAEVIEAGAGEAAINEEEDGGSESSDRDSGDDSSGANSSSAEHSTESGSNGHVCPEIGSDTDCGPPYPPFVREFRSPYLKCRIMHDIAIPKLGSTFGQLGKELRCRVDALQRGNVPHRNSLILLGAHPDANTLSDDDSECDDASPQPVTSDSDVSASSNCDYAPSASSRPGPHYHLVHDCSYTQSRCSCAIRKELQHGTFLRRLPRQNRLSYGYSEKQFFNLLCYLGISGRRTLRRIIINRTPIGVNGETGRYDRHVVISLLRRYRRAVHAYRRKRSLETPVLENSRPNYAGRKRRRAGVPENSSYRTSEMGAGTDNRESPGTTRSKGRVYESLEAGDGPLSPDQKDDQEEQESGEEEERRNREREQLELGLIPTASASRTRREASQEEEEEGLPQTLSKVRLLKKRIVARHKYQLDPEKFLRHGGHVYLNMNDRVAYQYIRVLVMEFLHQYFPTPVESLRHISAWHENGELVQIPERHAAINDAIGQYRRGLQHKSVDDIRRMLESDTATPVFAAPDGHVYKHYHSIKNSVLLLDMLLLHQYKTEANVAAFLTRVYRLLDKIDPKKNCMTISGPPNSGKTFFGNVLQGIMLSVGVIENCNRYHSFPFQTCVDKRLLFWDEPSLPSADALESLKLLFGGYSMSANIKYRNAQLIVRTPVLVMTNYSNFPSNEHVWSTRIYRERWRACAGLVKATKQAHPMAMFALWNKYGIDITGRHDDSELEVLDVNNVPSTSHNPLYVFINKK